MKSLTERLYLYIIILFFCLIALTSANAQKIKFKHLSTENGLSHSVVNCMIEDRLGFLWFGTQDGLNRFDGYQFKIFRNDEEDFSSLSDNNIWSLFEDNFSNIWIGTQKGTLNCFNPETEKFSRYILDSTETLSGNGISYIYQDKAKKLWIGTYKSGLYQLNINSNQINHWIHQQENPKSLSNNFVTSIFEDVKGNLWIGTFSGLCLFNRESDQDKFICYYHDPTNLNTLSHNTIWNFYQSKNDPEHIWVGTFNGLTYINIKNKLFTRIVPDQNNPNSFSRSISSICEDTSGKENKFWIGTYYGLLQMSKDNLQFTRSVFSANNPSGLTNDRINKVLIDRSGVLWIATQNGINYFSRQKDKFNFLFNRKYQSSNLDDLNNLEIQAICETSDETVWFGASNGLYSLSKFGKTFKVFNNHHFSEQNIWSLEADKSDDVWIGTFGNGLKHLDISSGKILHWTGNSNDTRNIRNAYVRAIHQDNSGFLWIGLWGGGLNRLNIKTGEITKWQYTNNDPQSLSNNDVWVIFEDRTGRIWIGTYGGGINLYDNGIFRKWLHDSNNEKSLCNNNILSICESVYEKKTHDDKTILWIGTANGLDKFIIHNAEFLNDGKIKVEIEHFLLQKDFSFNTVNSIVEDTHGFLWLTTNNGLIKFDPAHNKILNNYTAFDGLENNEFNPNSFCKSINGEIFIGSINGLDVFYPDSILNSHYTPPVVFTDFQIFNQPVVVGFESPLKTSINSVKEIILSYNHNVFSFQFASLDYNSPEMNQYAYMMEGFDKNWINSGTRRFVTYTNLDPGKYIFHVKATNSDGIWNKSDTQIAIIINPPYWATWWFRGLVLLTIVAIIYSFFRIRLNRLLELERLRIKIASDLHDDIGSALTRISLESELLKTETTPEEKKSAINHIGTMSREIITSMSDVVWSIDSRNDSIENLINRMKDFAFSLFSAKHVRVLFETYNLNFQKKLKVDIRQNIYLIFKEAINNAAKYSEADNIKVILKNDDGKFLMVIHDPETNFSPQKLTGQGLRNMQMRAKRIKGKIEFLKEEGFKVIFTGEEL